MSSAVMAVAGQTVYFSGVVLLYCERATDVCPVAVYSHYRVGLRFRFPVYHFVNAVNVGGVKPNVAEAWYPLAFPSLQNVLCVVNYLRDHLKEGELEVCVRAKQIQLPEGDPVTAAKAVDEELQASAVVGAVRLKRMRGDHLVNDDPRFGVERALVFPTTDWLMSATDLYTGYPMDNSACYARCESGRSGWVCARGGMLDSRCDNDVLRTLALSNVALVNGTHVGEVGDETKRHPCSGNGGAPRALWLDEPHLKYMHRTYNRDRFVSPDDLPLFGLHLGSTV
jgi:hypothetical protein